MNSKNQKYSPKLSREDIREYGHNRPGVQHDIERAIVDDPFAQDALDGWSKVDYQIDLMKKVDAKFLPNNKITDLFVFGTSIFALTVFLMGLLPAKSDSDATKLSQTNTKANAPLIIEESDIITDSIIEQMIESPSNKTASAPVLKKKFKEEQLGNAEKVITIDIEELPPLDLELPEPDPILREVKTRSGAKEIYVADLKLIDYRAYRSRPTIQTKQLELTGLPADREAEANESIESTWKTVDVPYHDYIKKTMEFVADGKYKKALQRFNTILATYPDDINAHFYSGICFYNLQEYQSAIDHFNSCLHHPFSNFDEESLWLIANSYQALGKHKDAQIIYQEIVGAKGFYAEQAKKKLKS